jgi:hypothetical protein
VAVVQEREGVFEVFSSRFKVGVEGGCSNAVDGVRGRVGASRGSRARRASAAHMSIGVRGDGAQSRGDEEGVFGGSVSTSDRRDVFGRCLVIGARLFGGVRGELEFGQVLSEHGTGRDSAVCEPKFVLKRCLLSC